ncbi:MAG: hypothetical protein IJB21_03880 [Bacilli bacterium]|nr:hypothetical protein [Bacilli bacterium]
MKKEVELKYIEFLNYYQSVKDLIDNIERQCDDFNILLQNIIDVFQYYYEEYENISIDESYNDFFENLDYVSKIFNRIKQIITFINNVFYDVLESDSKLFNSYIYIMEYIILLEDLIIFLKANDLEYDKYEMELAELKNIIYNKEEVTENLEADLARKEYSLNSEYKDFVSSSLLFQQLYSVVFGKISYNQNFEQEQDNYVQEMFNNFLNNMGSYEELIKLIKKNDISLYNKIFKLESVILKLQYSRVSNEEILGDNSVNVIKAYLIELTHLYDVWLIELDKVNDIYGIEYVIKYKDLIYYAGIVRDIIEYFGDINENNENLGDYYLVLYESILNNDMDDFEQFVLYGEDLVDQLCERYELVVNKLEEQIEFLYALLTKNN